MSQGYLLARTAFRCAISDPACRRKGFESMNLLLIVECIVALPARLPASPMWQTGMKPHQIFDRRAAFLQMAAGKKGMEPDQIFDRRTALQTAAAAALVATVPPARASELGQLDGGMVWIPKSEAPAKAARITTSYQPTFITYLSRFLLNYDRTSANWWRNQLAGLPLSQQPQQLKTIRERQFGQFSESVEVGLQRYQGKAGVRSLFSYLRSRYGTSPQAKLQLALLFSIISPRNQPSDLIRRALGQADNGMVTAAEILEGGRGYTRAESPEILVSAPAAGGTPAVVRAELRSTGQLVSITVASNGSGYPPGLTPAVRELH